MSLTPQISVVIPHYGDPRHAATLIGALSAQQDAPSIEIIVADDASPEPFVTDRFDVRVIRRDHNGGFGAAVNTGAATASADYLLVLNSDLTIEPTFLRRLWDAAQPYQPAVIGPMVVDDEGNSQWSGRTFPTTFHQTVEWLTILARFKDTRWRHRTIGHDIRCGAGKVTAVDWLVGAALLIPTDEFRAVGGFDERFFMNCEEVDLQRRLRGRGLPAVHLGTVTAQHVGGASSGDSTRRRTMLVRARFRYAAKWREQPVILAVALAVASVVNLVTNGVRRVAGRDLTPVATFRAELELIRRGWESRAPSEPIAPAPQSVAK